MRKCNSEILIAYVRTILKQALLEKFCRQIFPPAFASNLKKYMFENFEEILKADVCKILKRTILRKLEVKFSLINPLLPRTLINNFIRFRSVPPVPPRFFHSSQQLVITLTIFNPPPPSVIGCKCCRRGKIVKIKNNKINFGN